MSSDSELRDQAVAALELTTVGYKNGHWTIPPTGSKWKVGLDLLAQIGVAPQPPAWVVAQPLPPAPYQIPAGATVLPAVVNGPLTVNAVTCALSLRGTVINGQVNFISGSLQGVIVNGVIELSNTQAPPVLLDSYVHAGGAGTAISAYRPDGLHIERLVVDGFTNYGIRASTNNNTGEIIKRLWDITLNGGNQGGNTGGKGECGLWVGHPVADGVQRINARGAYTAAVWRGNAHSDTAWSDITAINDVGPGTSWYDEHITRNNTVKRYQLVAEPGALRAYQSEYIASFPWPAGAAGQGNSFDQGDVTGGLIGMNFWDVISAAVTNTRFAGQRDQALVLAASPNGGFGGTNRQSGNDFSGILPGCVAAGGPWS